MNSGKIDPRPWSFNLTKDEIQTIFEFAHQEFLERTTLFKKPEHFHIMCVLEGYSRFLEKQKRENI